MDEIIKGIQNHHSNVRRRISGDFGIDIVKGKPAQEGEERTWGGKKYKKQGGKWVPVGNDKKSAEKQSPQPKSSKKDQPQQQSGGEQSTSNHDIAQLTHMKKIMDSDPDKAYEIFQSLPPETQQHVPQDVVNKLVENSHSEKEDAAKEVFDKEKEKKEMMGVLADYDGNEIREAGDALGITDLVPLDTVGDIGNLKDEVKQKIKDHIEGRGKSLKDFKYGSDLKEHLDEMGMTDLENYAKDQKIDIKDAEDREGITTAIMNAFDEQ